MFEDKFEAFERIFHANWRAIGINNDRSHHDGCIYHCQIGRRVDPIQWDDAIHRNQNPSDGRTQHGSELPRDDAGAHCLRKHRGWDKGRGKRLSSRHFECRGDCSDDHHCIDNHEVRRFEAPCECQDDRCKECHERRDHNDFAPFKSVRCDPCEEGRESHRDNSHQADSAKGERWVEPLFGGDFVYLPIHCYHTHL